MELSENKEGNTVIGFIVSCVVEGKDLEIAMKVYEKIAGFPKHYW